MTLEDLLRRGSSDALFLKTVDFRIAIQEIYPDRGVRIIVHPFGYDGDTLDFIVLDNIYTTVEQGNDIRRKGKLQRK